MDCIINAHPRGGERYELLIVEPKGSKFINSICITFSESSQGERNKDQGMNFLETIMEKPRFKVEIPNMDTSSSEGISHRPLICDQMRRKIVLSYRDLYADFECYVLNVT